MAFEDSLLHVQDVKAAGVDGGTLNNDVWTTRDLNTVLTCEIISIKLDSNVITLPAGEYYCEARQPFYRTAQTTSRLYNTTNSAVLLYGLSGYSDSLGSGSSETRDQIDTEIHGRFTLDGKKEIELQIIADIAKTTDGLGRANGTLTTVTQQLYSDIKLWKIDDLQVDDGFSLHDITYAGNSHSFAEGGAQSTGIFFKPDGTKLYMASTSGDTVFEYDVSPAFDLTGVTYTGNSFSTSAAGIVLLHEIYISNDGLNMFAADASASQPIRKFTFGTAWDVTTLVDAAQSLDVSAQETNCQGLSFCPDGSRLFVGGSGSRNVHQYDLTTPWDLTTASFTATLSTSTQVTSGSVGGISFGSDGKTMTVTTGSHQFSYEYILTTAYDLTTGQYTGNSYDHTPAQDATGMSSCFYNPNGNQYFTLGISSDDIFEYSVLASSNPWSVLTAFYTKSFDTSAQGTNITGIDWTSDGTKCYIQISNTVYEYDALVPFDHTSLVYSGNSLATGLSGAGDIRIKPDGTAILVIGSSRLYSFTLSTPFDLSTAGAGTQSNVLLGSAPHGFDIKSDGSVTWITKNGTDDIIEYTFGTAWDVTTMTLNYTLDISGQDTNMLNCQMKPDGTKMIAVGNAGSFSDVYEYDLSTPYDLSTATYNGNTKELQETTTALGFDISQNGEDLYIGGNNNGLLFRYKL